MRVNTRNRFAVISIPLWLHRICCSPMRTSTIDERFSDFLEDPTADRLVAIREMVTRRVDYQPHVGRSVDSSDSGAWTSLSSAFDREDFSTVLELAASLSKPFCLCPRYHMMIGVAALELGDLPRAKHARRAYQACLDGLFETGEGTFAAPYLISYPSDAHEMLAELGVQACRQMLVEAGDARFDVLVDADGEEYWFDATAMLAAANRRQSAAAVDTELRHV